MKTPLPNEQEVAALHQKYPHGTMLRLIRMVDDSNPIEPGTVGEVDYIDDAGNIHMIWRNGRTLSLIPGADDFEVLPACPKCASSMPSDLRCRDVIDCLSVRCAAIRKR